MKEQTAKVIKKREGAKKVGIKVINGCWWDGEFCPYNSRHGGLKNANIGWCLSLNCFRAYAKHFLKIAKVVDEKWKSTH